MIIYNKSKLKRYKDMRRISQSLSNTFALGIQYEWFARFARQYNHKEIEVGFIRHEDNSDGVFTELIRVLARGEGHTCSIPENSKYPFISMFTSFRFPTLHLTKVEMGDLARKNGFHHLLALSWYCFNPGREGQRCGVCNPCKTAFLSGNVYSFLPEVHVPTEKYSLNRWFTNKILDV